mmetsp:Transcript_59504/g.128717  ORF Transcript_59504/g.128717 Transcript_59504/m.128717 type:complete len:257 (-) Transcript_59504:91-861(-)
MSGTRDENIFMAKLAEQSERFGDMVEYMKRVAPMGTELNAEERNLLSVAYKNSVGMRRSAWRAVNTILQRDPSKYGADIMEAISGYRGKIESELNGLCQDILEILAKNLIPSSSNSEAKVFYLKMKGDYHRYLAEFSSSEARSQHAKDAQESYEEASKVAVVDLSPVNPIRLGLALNYSVFHYEVLRNSSEACALASSTYESAVADAEHLSDEQYKDSPAILQLIRDNLTLWTSPEGKEDPEAWKVQQDGTAVEDL